MDLNEQAARARFSETLARMGMGGATDEQSAAVIREARANLAREQARAIVEEQELLDLFGVPDLDAFNDLLPTLCSLGWRVANPSAPSTGGGPEIHIRVIARSDRRGDRQTIYVERYLLDRWLAAHDAITDRLGSPKAPSSRVSAKRVAGVAGLSTLAALVFQIFS